MTPKQIEDFAENIQEYGVDCFDKRNYALKETDCKGKLVFYKMKSDSPVYFISCKKHLDKFCKENNDLKTKIFNFSEKDVFYLRLLIK